MAIAQQPVVTGMRASWHEIAADEKSEVLMTAMKLAGIDRLWFVSGTELGFFQEAHVKNKVLGRPTPDIMTMTHENACLAAACGETVITGRPSATAAHVEVGLLNYGGAIHNASRGNYPVLMMSGYPPSAESGSVPGARNSFIQWYQQISDQGQIVRQYTKWDHKLASYDNPGDRDHTRRADHALRRARSRVHGSATRSGHGIGRGLLAIPSAGAHAAGDLAGC